MKLALINALTHGAYFRAESRIAIPPITQFASRNKTLKAPKGKKTSTLNDIHFN